MTVTASVVNVYGGVVNNAGEAARTAVNLLTTAGGAAAGTAGAAAGKALLTGGARLALPAAAGASAACGLGSGYVITAPTAAAGKDIVLGTTSSMLTAACQSWNRTRKHSLYSRRSCSCRRSRKRRYNRRHPWPWQRAIDLFQGIGKENPETKKEPRTNTSPQGRRPEWSARAQPQERLIGSVVPGVGTAIGALVGAGIGGAGALLGGDKAGKALSDASDPGGWLSNAGKAIGDFFTKTLPKGWNSFWGGVGNFFTNTIPKWWGNLTAGVSTFFTETIPAKWSEFWESRKLLHRDGAICHRLRSR